MKVAVIGCGVMGNHHARNYNDIKGVELTSVCDINPQAAKELARSYKTKHYINHKKLIKSEHPDAVSITTPTSTHKKVAADFINAGISVLIEKPIAHNIKDSETIINLASKNKVILAVGHIERFNPAVDKLQELISKKVFGEILSVVVRRVGLFPNRISDVDVITDLAVHDLDIVTHLIGKLPHYVYARASGALTHGRADHAEIFLGYKNFGCFIQVNWITPVKIRQLSITGTKGHAELDYISQKLSVYDSLYFRNIPKGFKEFLVKFSESKKRNIRVKQEEPLKAELKNFISSVKRKSTPLVSGAEGLTAVKLAHYVHQSVIKDKPIKVI